MIIENKNSHKHETDFDMVYEKLKKWISIAGFLLTAWGVVLGLIALIPPLKDNLLLLILILALWIITSTSLFVYIWYHVVLRKKEADLQAMSEDQHALTATIDELRRSLGIEKTKSKLEDIQTLTHEQIYLINSLFFGMNKDNYTVEAEIPDLQGGKITNFGFDIRAVDQNVERIEYHYRIPEYDKDPPDNIGIELLTKKYRQYSINLIPISKEVRKVLYAIEIVPELKKGESIPISSKLISPKGTFAMTLEELKNKNMLIEYSNIRIDYPTNLLKYRLLFPPNYIPKQPGFDVWFGDGKVRHLKEYARILNNPEFFNQGIDISENRFLLCFNIPFPLQGLYYSFRWLPSQ